MVVRDKPVVVGCKMIVQALHSMRALEQPDSQKAKSMQSTCWLVHQTKENRTEGIAEYAMEFPGHTYFNEYAPLNLNFLNYMLPLREFPRLLLVRKNIHALEQVFVKPLRLVVPDSQRFL